MRIIKRLFQKLCISIREIPNIFKDCKAFGCQVGFVKYRRKLGLITAKKYIDIISLKMEEELKEVILRYQNGQVKTFMPKYDFGGKIPVFFSWLQGKEHMPKWCAACYNNLINILPSNTELVFITFENYKSYIDIPQQIIDRFEKEKAMCVPNYSDIIRNFLLATYGGCWIDAAIYLSKGIFEEAFNYEIYSPRFYKGDEKILDASRGKWAINCWFSTKSSILFKYVAESLTYFWEKHNRALDYLAVDYMIWAAYINIAEISNLIDSIPVNNTEIRLLNSLFEEVYDEKNFNQLINKQKIHLVNRHKEYKCKIKGKETVYGHILSINGVSD